MRPALARLAAAATAPVPADLLAWAASTGSDDGPLPLLGAGRRAAHYPALLWNGARLHLAGAPDADGLTLVALASAAADAPVELLEQAVVTGLALDADLAAGTDGGTLLARPTTGVVAAAACAAVAAGITDLGPVLDLAAGLMVVQPVEDGTVAEAALARGHCLAAGWLAPRALGAGLIGMPDALLPTLETVTGRPAEPVSVPQPSPVPAGRGERAADLLAALS
ncbi:hypothetical protein QOZ88_01070 [Blastococcus sp. BMG 814]|uniref:Uncharacterized protein n=1 Tax=Blastococcus carthaginiensis TaxID=3050034 RepID=A0ABT9I6M6_9ACTN|nr:hypothetical protein [Blastococcus carthaginiensis]MDP5181218.1 hypothetical protein [Blastococcus carthaginiensis]